MTGNLIVITGCMFSGKSHKIITESEKEGEPIFFQPQMKDNENQISSRSGESRSCVLINPEKPEEIKEHILNEDVIAIDEVQFFNKHKLINLVEDLLLQEKTIVVSGLDLDFKGDPFQPVPHLMSMANKIIKTTAECNICGNEATMTQRLINEEPASKEDSLIVLGSETYEPRCRKCHKVQ